MDEKLQGRTVLSDVEAIADLLCRICDQAKSLRSKLEPVLKPAIEGNADMAKMAQGHSGSSLATRLLGVKEQCQDLMAIQDEILRHIDL